MTTRISEPLEARFRAEARARGFVAVGITPAEQAPASIERLRAWLAAGMHGGMAWMEGPRREQPRAMWAEARSAILLGFPYTPSHNPFRNARRPEVGTISVYALGRDYHDVIKPRLKALARWLLSQADRSEARVFVDTAPIMEKPLAEAAGIGWQGKHSNLVSRIHGNWLFLATILTSVALLPGGEPGAVGTCGSCTRCIAACPTGAIVAPYVVDARRCISYLTVEHRGPVDEALRPMLGNRVHGCDDCLAVCPWNRFAHAPADPALAPREGNVAPQLSELLALDEPGFRTRFAGTPVRRTGRDRFIRNCLYAAGNSGTRALLPAVERLLADPDPTVADAARWAADRLRKLSPP